MQQKHVILQTMLVYLYLQTHLILKSLIHFLLMNHNYQHPLMRLYYWIVLL
uniref:Uncharacterized protein n=1 Tax=uncultured marine virus TaxID=186617 RepID=A0A0F7LAG1_9VIRU|nr:hypothetical protein [uncultured marine virus]